MRSVAARKCDVMLRISQLRFTASGHVDKRCLHLQSHPIGCRPLLYLEHSAGQSISDWFSAVALRMRWLMPWLYSQHVPDRTGSLPASFPVQIAFCICTCMGRYKGRHTGGYDLRRGATLVGGLGSGLNDELCSRGAAWLTSIYSADTTDWGRAFQSLSVLMLFSRYDWLLNY